jgi:alpha-beta hydrolase superfamily lysophospholipase
LSGRLAVLLLLCMAACVPRLQPAGEASVSPSFAEDRLVMDDGTSLPLRVWQPAEGPPKAVILALHGFNDYSNAFAAPAEAWAQDGIATYAYDQRGFGNAPWRGLWAGDRRMMQDVREALALVAARNPGVPVYLLGESMGGALALAVAASEPKPAIAGLILSAPAIWGRDNQGMFYSTVLWFAAHSVPWMTFTGEGLQIQPSDNIAMLRGLGRDPLVIKATRVDAIYGLVGLMDRAWEAAGTLEGPALVLYGAHEEVIPPEVALRMLRRLPPDFLAGSGPNRAALYPRGYHMLLRDIHAAEVQQDVVAWIEHPDAPLPSGADKLAEKLVRGPATTVAAAALPAPPMVLPTATASGNGAAARAGAGAVATQSGRGLPTAGGGTATP